LGLHARGKLSGAFVSADATLSALPLAGPAYGATLHAGSMPRHRSFHASQLREPVGGADA
jgi:hypothetical protein